MDGVGEFKARFYSGGEYIHLNNSGQGLIPDVNRDAHLHWLNRLYEEGAHCSMEMWAETDRVRAKLARFLGAEAEQLAYFTTTASALSQAAASVPLKDGDEVLTWDQEYPSNFYPWRLATEKAGARLVQVPSVDWATPVEELLRRVGPRTRAIAISWVQYQTGAITDLKALSSALRGSGIWLVADIIQGVGVRAFDFTDSGFDVVCGGSHKFLCSGYGAGFMVINKNKLKEMAPVEVGAMTYGDPDTEKSFSIQPKPDARKFEPGSKAAVEIIGLGATLDLYNAAGCENIFREAARLGRRLRVGLQERGYRVHSPEGPIVTFETANLDLASERLSAAKVSFVRRGPGIRLSTHAYNTDAEVDKVLELMGGQ